MEFRRLGRSGLTVSLAGVGCNNFGMRADQELSRQVVKAALDAGVTLFDTADIYGQGRSEEFLGAALAGHRHEVVIATKFGNPMGAGPYRSGAGRRYVISACEASLRRLGTDYIDLYQVHVPDPATPIDETLSALDDLVHQGKVRYVGSSNFAGWQIAEAEHTARELGSARFVSAQNEWNLIQRGVEQEVVPACAHYGVGVLPFFPLASGLLTGKYRKGQPFPLGSRFAVSEWFRRMATDAAFEVVERLVVAATARGRSMVEMAAGWLAAQPTVASVIAGAMDADQVQANCAALARPLDADDLAAITEALVVEQGDG